MTIAPHSIYVNAKSNCADLEQSQQPDVPGSSNTDICLPSVDTTNKVWNS